MAEDVSTAVAQAVGTLTHRLLPPSCWLIGEQPVDHLVVQVSVSKRERIWRGLTIGRGRRLHRLPVCLGERFVAIEIAGPSAPGGAFQSTGELGVFSTQRRDAFFYDEDLTLRKSLSTSGI